MKYKLFFLLLSPLFLFSQIGSESVFGFINIENSPRVEAMGGNAMAIYDNDITLTSSAPSLLNRSMHNSVAFLFGDYFSDISIMSFLFAHDINGVGTMGLCVRSINYGEFERNDQFGNNQGNFSASDQVFCLGLSKKINKNFNLGVNLNFIKSTYDTYNAFGLSSNISANYFLVSKQFYSTILFKNIGRQLEYYSALPEKLPFEIQFAICKKLKYLPFMYHLTYHNVNQFDIKSPYKLIEQTNPQTGNLEIKPETNAKTFLRHFIIGGELNPFRKNLFLRGGFNFQRRFDMTTILRPAMVGFSWGIGFRLAKYRFDYSRSIYHLSGAPNNFSISTNLSTFRL